MNNDRNAFKAGLFIIVSMLAAGAIIVSIRGAGHVISPMVDRKVDFSLADNVGGLRVGDEVRLGGYKVGTVREIGILSDGKAEPHILVTFSMPSQYVLRDDSKVVVESSLTGVSYVNIEHLGQGTEQQIATGSPGALGQFLTGLGDMTPDLKMAVHDARTVTLPKVDSTVDAAHQLIAHVDSKIDPVVAHYNVVTERAGETLTNARDVLGDTKVDIRSTMKHLNSATGTISDKLPGVMEQVHVALDKVQTTLDSARGALADVKRITETGKDLIVGNRGKLQSMIASLKLTSDNLKAASIEIRRSPWRLLYKPSENEMANLNLYDAARQFSDGADNLTDAAGALRDAMSAGSMDKAQVEKLSQQLDDSFANFKQVEDKLWKSVRQ